MGFSDWEKEDWEDWEEDEGIICPICNTDLDDEGVCPICGWEEEVEE